MFYKIKEVKALPGLELRVLFIGGAVKIYDMKPIIKEIKAFKIFEKNPKLFQKVKVDTGGYGIIWNAELDIACNELWENGVAENEYDVMGTELLCYLIAARHKKGLSQRELGEEVGVKQPVIARVENGDSDPQLSTLIKMAKACNVNINCSLRK